MRITRGKQQRRRRRRRSRRRRGSRSRRRRSCSSRMRKGRRRRRRRNQRFERFERTGFVFGENVVLQKSPKLVSTGFARIRILVAGFLSVARLGRRLGAVFGTERESGGMGRGRRRQGGRRQRGGRGRNGKRMARQRKLREMGFLLGLGLGKFFFQFELVVDILFGV